MQSTKHTIQNLLVNEKSVFVVVYTKKKNNNNSGQSRGVRVVTCKTTLRDQVIKLLINISQLRSE